MLTSMIISKLLSKSAGKVFELYNHDFNGKERESSVTSCHRIYGKLLVLIQLFADSGYMLPGAAHEVGGFLQSQHFLIAQNIHQIGPFLA